MTNKLRNRDPIDGSSLDPSRYFQSLLARAAGAGLPGITEAIRRDTLLLAAKMAQRYTFGASSSVTAETAQALLESAMYCIGRRLKAVETGEAVKLLNELPVEQIWSEGKELLRGDLAAAGKMLDYLQENAFKADNAAYSNTLYEALPSFFAAYDVEYAAHETPCLIDYPLFVEPHRLTGVEYILGYLKALGMENRLCAGYREQIEPLLRGYSPEWRDLNINIFELALTNAIGRVLCGKDAGGLDISEEDREKLRPILAAANSRLKAIVCMAAQRISSEMKFPKPLRNYVMQAAGQIVPRVKTALETGSLGSVFITLKDKPADTAYFKDAGVMDDEAFRSVTDEIRDCRHMSDKLALIKQNIRSIADLADMLGALCLHGAEYDALFAALDDETLALLFSRLPEEGAMYVTEGEGEWHGALLKYLEGKGIIRRISKAAGLPESKI